ncbi:MAG: pro-sigmaK processing inhibitor BofA family protein [Methanimicrococcus sp.]|nr:pro-sigmaK processing inhibitor BofA family protein [Methanimicrococcus sp.]
MESLVTNLLLVVIALAIAYVLYKVLKSAKKFAINVIVGFILILITNLLNLTNIPINFSTDTLITVVVTALSGVFGALFLIVLNIFDMFPF